MTALWENSLNVSVDTDYARFFGHTILELSEGFWLHNSPEESFKKVRTDNIPQLIEIYLEADRRNGVISQVAGIEMSPRFALLLYQQGVLMYEHFKSVVDDNGAIHVPELTISGISVGVWILENPPFDVRTVDVDGVLVQ